MFLTAITGEGDMLLKACRHCLPEPQRNGGRGESLPCAIPGMRLPGNYWRGWGFGGKGRLSGISGFFRMKRESLCGRIPMNMGC